MPRKPPFTEAEARAAIAKAKCWSDALRLLGYAVKGHNFRTLQRWAAIWGIPRDHFDATAARRRSAVARTIPLDQILVENSTYPRGHLKRRLFKSGLKMHACELCGQGETWNGRRMSLVLDHINGVSNDHRLENLRMVCPNCAATLDTHCGRKYARERACPSCGSTFEPIDSRHRYCSQECWGKAAAALYAGSAHPETRRVERPSYDDLQADLASMSFVAVGRKYGVSDNAVRKWLRWYERQAGRDADSSGGADRQAA